MDGQVVKTIVTNSPMGSSKMPKGSDFGLKNATFTYNEEPFTSSTTFTSDITVTVAGTAAYKLTLSKTSHGSIAVNNTSVMPGTLKKITATPDKGYVVSAVTATDSKGNALPVTPVSNTPNEYVFVFPKASVTVKATFAKGTAEATQFINDVASLLAQW